ncbi:MAG TPA: hypothetical protein VGE15_08450 [Sphingobacteriaceae bacterium]
MEAIPKIEMFRDVDALMIKLSETESGNFRPWRFDGYRWISFSDYYYFGSPAGPQGFQNNLAYYVSSSVEPFAEDLKLVLNIYNELESAEAITTFIRLALRTYSILDLEPPRNLLTSISADSELDHEDDLHYSHVRIVKAHIPSWRVIIETK